MATINLEIRSNKLDKLVPVYLRVRTSEIHFRIKTEFLVLPEYWSASKEELKPQYFDALNFSVKQRNDLEQGLRDIKSYMLREIAALNSTGKKVDRDSVADLIRKFHGKVDPSMETLNKYIARFIKEIKNGERLHDHNGHHNLQKYEDSTIKSYVGFQVQLNEFQGKKKLNFDDIDMIFYNKFVQFFYKKGNSPNTAGRHIKQLKKIMRASRDERLHNNMEVERKEFRVIRVPVQNIYLTEDEIQKLFDLELSGPNELARDLFIIGCDTAQRFSDYRRIVPEMYQTLEKGQRVIDLIQNKTKNRVVIPIKPRLAYLLEKYGNRSPKMAEQKLNDRIKIIAGTAGIDNPVTIEQYRGGSKERFTVPKNTLIQTHTARRSGCTNMYKRGIKTIDIMKISGHKSEKEFYRYILVNEEETAERLGVHSYFTEPTFKPSTGIPAEIDPKNSFPLSQLN